MIFRPVSVADLAKIEKIHEDHHKGGFPLPDLRTALFSGVAADLTGDVKALVVVRNIAEAIMILDTDRPRKELVASLRSVIENALFGSFINHVDMVHVFVQDPKFSEILKKHFGFRTCKGEALVYEV